MKVKECMCSKVVSVKPDATIQDVAKQMQECHVGCMPVCNDEKKIVGIVTDRDVILRCIACDKEAKQTPVSEIMTTDIYTVAPEDTVSEAIEYMCECQVKRIPVIEEGVLKGIITLGDLAKDPDISDTTVGTTAKNICCGHHNKE